MKGSVTVQDSVRGSLIGGAVGDALGYTVEFMHEDSIAMKFGLNGITEYELKDGKARISDDTQMTLFTAAGVLLGDADSLNGITTAPGYYVPKCYHDWYITQTCSYTSAREEDGGYSGLMDVKELFARRAPGNTCMYALSSGINGSIENPVNDSKGCGGIMRVAPLALRYRPGDNFKGSIEQLDREGAEIAALTHGHPLAYMPAAAVTHVIALCLTKSAEMSLEEMVLDARRAVSELFAGDRQLKRLTYLIDLALELSKCDTPDIENIHDLGAGWVAEETLAIALYCALKYKDDFSKAIITSVNHNGDSDSTGAVTGNILGAYLGYQAIDDKWKRKLELNDLILGLADELAGS